MVLQMKCDIGAALFVKNLFQIVLLLQTLRYASYEFNALLED